MNQNLLLDHVFSNEGEVGDEILLYAYTGTGTEGKTLPAISDLNGALVLFAFKDGLQYRRVDAEPEDLTGKQFNFNETTNVITFSNETADIQLNEDISIVYTPEAGEFNEPVTLDEAKNWIRIPLEITSEDDQLKMCIRAARIKIENYLKISLIARVVELYVQIQASPYKIPFGPQTTIISITDESDNIIDPANYNLRGVFHKELLFGGGFCNAYGGGNKYINFQTSGAFDDEFKLYILKQTAWSFEHRGDEQETRLAPGLEVALKSKRKF